MPSHSHPGPQVYGTYLLGLYWAALARMASTSSPSDEESLLDDELESLPFFFFFLDFLAGGGDVDCKSDKNNLNC